MLNNLEKVRKQKNVTLADMADVLGLRYQTVADKIAGEYDFKFGEAVKLKNTFFPEYDLTYLFTASEEVAT